MPIRDKGTVMKFLSGSLFFALSVVIAHGDADYAVLLEAVKKYQNGYSDANALQIINNAARSEDYEAVVTRCMVIYALHMGTSGNVAKCQGGVQVICNRYPNSEVASQLRQLSLFPSPCETCQGIGTVPITSVSGCSACENSGKCRRCGGVGTVKGAALKGRTRIGVWRYNHGGVGDRHTYRGAEDRTFYHDYGSGTPEPTERPDIKCSVCRGSGNCPTCDGIPAKEHSSTTSCPTCNGVANGIDSTVAKNYLMRICQDTKDSLQKAVDCESAYTSAMQSDDPQQRSAALKACLVKYEGAFNLAMVSEAQKSAAEMEQKRLISEQQTREKHANLLQVIRDTKSRRAAMIEIQKFLEDKPDSPMIVEARLLAAEIAQHLADQNKAAKREQNMLVGCAALVGFALLVWFVSCIKSARPARAF